MCPFVMQGCGGEGGLQFTLFQRNGGVRGVRIAVAELAKAAAPNRQ